MDDTPRALGYRWPAEWELHAATWLSWPHNRDTWPGVFDAALDEYVRFVKAIACFEPVRVLASGRAADNASAQVGSVANVTIHDVETNDAWIRDHGPTFLGHDDLLHMSALVNWDYNAWGEKYPPFDADNRVPSQIAILAGRKQFIPGFVLEGGAIDGNGGGIAMTTRSCALNSNRNHLTTQAAFERLLSDCLAIDQVVWLEGEIPGDDTDGHVDQIARFVSEKIVVCSTNEDIPVLQTNMERVRRSGVGLTPVELPMPAAKRLGGMRLPASYANFYIANGAVIVPQFDDTNDSLACSILGDHFVDREIIGLPAGKLVAGLGAFHCLTQQEYSLKRKPI